jgi:hypothetical protein
MVIAMLTLLICLTADFSAFVPNKDLSEAQFVVRTVKSGDRAGGVDGPTGFFYGIFDRKAPPSAFSINVEMYDRARRGERINLGDRAVGRKEGEVPNPFEGRTFSGIPLGQDQSSGVGEMGCVVEASTAFETLEVGISHRSVIEDGRNQWPDVDTAAEKILVERVARIVFARAAGVRLGGFNTRTLAGTSIQSATCTKTNRLFGNLRSYAMNKGWKVAENDDLAYWTLSKGDHYAVIPYGSGRIKFDGTWVKMADVTMEKEGVLLAGEDVLNRLNAMD